MRNIILLTAAATIAGCTIGQVSTAQRVVAEGQLVCARATAAGAVLVAAADANGAPIKATGAAQATLAAICAEVQGVAISPPPAGTQVPVVTVTPPGA
jgi:hypothetical protein